MPDKGKGLLVLLGGAGALGVLASRALAKPAAKPAGGGYGAEVGIEIVPAGGAISGISQGIGQLVLMVEQPYEAKVTITNKSYKKYDTTTEPIAASFTVYLDLMVPEAIPTPTRLGSFDATLNPGATGAWAKNFTLPKTYAGLTGSITATAIDPDGKIAGSKSLTFSIKAPAIVYAAELTVSI